MAAKPIQSLRGRSKTCGAQKPGKSGKRRLHVCNKVERFKQPAADLSLFVKNKLHTQILITYFSLGLLI
ncbi:hypothetical protein NDU88_002330 [Pleurodeles waltl]|uniref:Uncharacterized protein n=1 Tax=Pleurodeles waltl TaxID=8319 RepID=A0AAV7Q6A9_PLEWA|nr:hypothetical protein NDU88_002330 [Pleurodeles waltl]